MCKKHRHAYPNGLLALKGGSMEGEIKALPGNGFEYTELFPLRAVFTEPFFDEKLIVYVQG
jgi:16S rRNA (guanine527-N7)-methyltransferase